jgi:hypothetical protein
MEQQLVKILNIAFTWKAVLLLDEADIYFEKRTSGNTNRNAMTGIFLRHLEYYQGKKDYYPCFHIYRREFFINLSSLFLLSTLFPLQVSFS